MKIKFANGGVMKFQNPAGPIPDTKAKLNPWYDSVESYYKPSSMEYSNTIEGIRNNTQGILDSVNNIDTKLSGQNLLGDQSLENTFEKWEQRKQSEDLIKEAEKRASERIAQEDKGLLQQMRFAGEAGELSQAMNRNARMAKYVAEELGLDGNQAFIDSYMRDGAIGLKTLGKAALTGLELSIPLGNMARLGLFPGALKSIGQYAGWGLGSWGGGKLGKAIDNYFGTEWSEPVLSIAGGLRGWNPGGNAMYKLSKGLLRKQMARQFAKTGNINVPKWWASKNVQRDVLLDDPYVQYFLRNMMKSNPRPSATHPSRQLEELTPEWQFQPAYKVGGILKAQKGLGKLGKAVGKVTRELPSIPNYGKMSELDRLAMEQAFRDMQSAKMPLYDEASVLRLPARETLTYPSRTSGIRTQPSKVMGYTTRGRMGRADLMDPDYGSMGTLVTPEKWREYQIKKLHDKYDETVGWAAWRGDFLSELEKQYYKAQAQKIEGQLNDFRNNEMDPDDVVYVIKGTRHKK